MALLRIAIGFLIILDLIIRVSSLTAHYTAEGVLPNYFLLKYCWNKFYFSIYTISDNYYIIILLFCLHFFLALLLIFGVRTRWVTLFLWIFTVSLHNRQPFILQGGDDLLRLTLFWGITIPWGNRYSIDSLKSSKVIDNNEYFSWSSIGFMMLQFSLYFISALLKDSPEWRSDFTALYYAYSLDILTWPASKWIYYHPDLLKALTAYTFYLEWLGPFLLFIPIKNHWFRFLFIIQIVLLHVGICVTLFVGLFFWFGLSTCLAHMPVSLMDKIEKWYAPLIIKTKAFVLHHFKIDKINDIGGFSNLVITNYYFRFIRNCCIVFIIVFCFFWNLGTVRGGKLTVHENFHWLGYMFRLDQNWGMFAPTVYKDDGWFILEATTLDDKKIDIYRNGIPVRETRPANILAEIKDDRWRKYNENLIFDSNANIRPLYCKYLFREWNKNNPHSKIKNLAIFFMKETTLPDYRYSPIKKMKLCDCK
jgi:hypothetical protein